MRHALILLLSFLSFPILAFAQDTPSPDETVKQALADRKLKVRYDSTPVDEVLDELRERSGVNVAVVASATADKTVTLKGNGVSARSVLDAIAAADDGFTYEVWRGFVFVSAKGAVRKAPPAPDLSDEARKTCTERRITASFADVTVAEFLDYIAETTGVSFSAAQAVADARFSLRVKDAPATNVLDVVCRLLDLKVQRAGEVHVLKSR
ncbi:MAG: hypothetical protein ACAI25_09155 [Planctomycetota bacterium]